MGEFEGFLKYERREPLSRPVVQRLHDYHDVYEPVATAVVMEQGARCLDCGIPYCHVACPVGNYIPRFNDLVFEGDWRRALVQLHNDNNFPEFTGHVCPALCEGSCTLGLGFQPVAIKMVELKIIEMGFERGWVQPEPPHPRYLTGKRVAVIGSGPAGLAAAQQLRRAGHEVTVFERDDRLGGLLRYGIPDFKLEKHLIDRRLNQLEAEGVVFKTGVEVGRDIEAAQLRQEFDAVLLATGSGQPRDLAVEGRSLSGIHFAMQYLTQQNRRCAGEAIDPATEISAQGKHVVVIGGGDTGADCVGTSLRQGALSVTSLEVMPQPPSVRAKDNPWPEWPRILRTPSSHEEGGTRLYGVSTKRLVGDESGAVSALEAVHVNWRKDGNGRMQMSEVAGSNFTIPCGLVLLAMGFTGPVRNGLLGQFGVELDERGNVATNNARMTSVDGVFSAGDMRRGQSLVVWAIAEGRDAAKWIDSYLRRK